MSQDYSRYLNFEPNLKTQGSRSRRNAGRHQELHQRVRGVRRHEVHGRHHLGQVQGHRYLRSLRVLEPSLHRNSGEWLSADPVVQPWSIATLLLAHNFLGLNCRTLTTLTLGQYLIRAIGMPMLFLRFRLKQKTTPIIT